MPLISRTFREMLRVKVGNENLSFISMNLLSHNNYCSVGVMELCLLNLFILIDCFLCNSYPCVLFESLSHEINQEPYVTREISKFQKSELGKFIPNFPLKHMITGTNLVMKNVFPLQYSKI